MATAGQEIPTKQDEELMTHVNFLRGAFRLASTNGTISDTESLLQLVRSIGLNPTEGEVLAMMCKHDEDDDGEIDEMEFLQIMSDKLHPFDTDEEMRTVFRAFDRDGNGFIDAEELRFVFRQIHGDKTDDILEEIEDVITEFDKDGDGVLNYEEFLRVLASGFQAQHTQ